MKIKFEEENNGNKHYYRWESEDGSINITIGSFDAKTSFAYSISDIIAEYGKYKFDAYAEWNPERVNEFDVPVFYTCVSEHYVTLEDATSGAPELLRKLERKINSNLDEMSERMEDAETSKCQFEEFMCSLE